MVDQFPTIRLGRILGATLDNGCNEHFEFSYTQADTIIQDAIDHPENYSERIFQDLFDSGIMTPIQSGQLLEKFNRLYATSRSSRTSKFLPAVDLEDKLVSIGNYHFLVRPSLSFCSSMNGYDPKRDEKQYSKSLLRLMLVGKNGNLFDKDLPVEELISAFEYIAKCKRALLDSIHKSYDGIANSFLISLEKEPIKIGRIGDFGIFSSATWEDEFDTLKMYWDTSDPMTNESQQRAEASNRDLSTVANAVFSANDNKDYQKIVSSNPDTVLAEISKHRPESTNDLVFLEDPDGWIGVYFSSIDDDDTLFVGTARVNPAPFENDCSPTRISKTSPNVTSAIVCNDLVVGI